MSRSVGEASALALAERAHDAVQEDPNLAAATADQALRQARAERNLDAEAAALHALGFAQYELGHAGAIRTLRAAVRVAQRGGHLRRAAYARRTLAGSLAHAGRMRDALREIDAACAGSRGLDRARAEVVRLAVIGRTGTVPGSLAPAGRALRLLRRHGDEIWEARLLHNRGFLLAEAGDHGAAAADLERARQLYAGLGAALAAAVIEVLLARSTLATGDIVSCLEHLDAVDPGSLAPHARARLELSRAEALVGARLLEEASAALQRALAIWDAAAGDDAAAKGRLEAARLMLLAGDAESARVLATGLVRSFAARGQPVYAARASALRLAAEISANQLRASSVASGRRAAEQLEAGGWRLEAQRTRLLVARAALELGSTRIGNRELARAAPLRESTIADRVEYLHVEALVRLAERDTARAERALRGGLQLLDEYRAAFGSSELRVTASTLGVELAARGSRLALDARDPERFLAWTERLRANALRLPAVRPPEDEALRAYQNELRHVSTQIRIQQERGVPDRGLVARQVALEARISARTRHARGTGDAPTSLVCSADAAAVLGERALVEYVELDGSLRAVTLRSGRLALHELGDSSRAYEQLEWLRFAMTRLSRLRRGDSHHSQVLSRAHLAAARLDELLVAPLLPAVGDAPLALVPTGALHALPWATLPSLRGRPVVVAPSLSVWLDLAQRTPPTGAKTALIAGPRVHHAPSEVHRLAGLHPGAIVLDGPAATSAAALAAMDGAALAHLACHGRFRADSPLFSALELHDGPVTALDLQQMSRPPDILVLAACDLALSDRHPGDELLGLAAAVLAMGTRTIIATVVPVPDADAHRLMLALHRRLAAGAEPAAALADVTAHDDPGRFSGFVCLGNG